MPIIRLKNITKDLNISIQRAIEFLHSKGIEIDSNPNTKVEEHIYNLLIQEFQSDKDQKAASHEVVFNKIIENKPIETPKTIEPTTTPEQKENNISKATAPSEKIIKAKAESITGIKTLGKIDLKEIGKPKKEENTEEKIEEEKTEENIVEKQPTQIEKIETKYQKLDGPKITGEKIDLSTFNKPPKEKNDNKTNNNEKKKRTRIKKDNNTSNSNNPNTINSNNNTNNNNSNNYRNNNYQSRPFRKPPPVVTELSDEDVKNQIKETLEKLTNKGGKSKSSKYRRDKRIQRRETEAELQELEQMDKTLKITEFITVNELASLIDVSPTEIISACFSLGVMVTMNQRLDAETLTLVADEFGYQVQFIDAEIEEAIQDPEEEDAPEELLTRAPIVTVMGHVDHGKTSLLDYIRKTNVIAGESGGITQHIGAYSVELSNGQHITFLDTPGHEAFTAMRARGAQATDIAIIVIAADDDVMPQTKEAISHAQAAGVPMIIAINKIDKPAANPDKIKEQLSQMNILVEEWGGNVQSQEISAKGGINIDQLLEKVLLQAEILELKANPKRLGQGVVIEASLDKGRGYIATLLVQNGTLQIGDYLLAGKNHGKIKAMMDERGHQLKDAKPSTPVIILGLDGAPTAGDKFKVFEDEREAKQLANKREQLQREQSIRTQKHISLTELGRRIALGNFKELNLILKGDVDGSVEALTDSLQKLSTEEIHINILLKSVGQITETDVLLASASDAIIIGFNVRPNTTARELAEKEEVEIRNYSIIYDAINEVKEAMEGMLSPEIKEQIIGNVEIREVFKISKIGTVAGCMVLDGKITRNSKIRIIRDGVVVHDGELESLKRFKDDVKEVTKGYECGLNVKNYNNIEINDLLEVYEEIKVKKTLK